MKLSKYLHVRVLAGLLLTAGCSGPVYVQKDDTVNLNNYKTYMWVDTRANENDSSARTSAYADISVRNSVNAELSKARWREVSDNPDVLVSYDILVERTTGQRSDPVYSQPFTRIVYPLCPSVAYYLLSFSICRISNLCSAGQGRYCYYYYDGRPYG